jgi:hypothetical protein
VEEFPQLSVEHIDKLKSEAKAFHEQEAASYNSSKSNIVGLTSCTLNSDFVLFKYLHKMRSDGCQGALCSQIKLSGTQN